MSTDAPAPVEEQQPPATETPTTSQTVGLDALSEEDFPQTADDVNGMYGARGELQPEPDAAPQSVDPAANPEAAPEIPPQPVDPAAQQAPPAVDPNAPPVQQGPTFDQQVAALGIQGVTPENAGQMLLQQHQANLQRQQQMQMQYGQVAQDYQNLLQDPSYRAYQEQQNNQPEPVEEEKPGLWENPYPAPSQMQLNRYAEPDGEGGYRWKTDPVSGTILAPAKFREDVDQHVMHKQAWEQRLRDEPDAVIQEAINAHVPKLVEQQMAEQRSKMEDDYHTEKILQENRDWMVTRNPMNGQEEWTPQGQFYGHEMYALQQKGHSVQEAHEYAFAKTLREYAPYGQQQAQQAQPPAPVQQPPQPLSPAEQAEAMKRQHVAAGGNILTDQSASANPPAQQQTLDPSAPDLTKYLDTVPADYIDYVASLH